jgi:hypothetical protein
MDGQQASGQTDASRSTTTGGDVAAGSTGSGSTQAAGTTGGASAGAAQSTEGALYRLAPPTGQDLKQFTGRRVEIVGQLMPGRDEKGADVVIHRIEPDKTVVTAIDLKPAPELRVSSMRELPGSCANGQAR